MTFAFWFFGHHQAGAQTPWGAAWSFVLGVPVPIWVAAIGLGAAVLTPFLQHALTRNGERKEAKRVARRSHPLGIAVRSTWSFGRRLTTHSRAARAIRK